MHDECPCGGRKSAAMLVCISCWNSSDPWMRRTWRSGEDSEQRDRARALLRHARNRRPAAPKRPKQLHLL
jgi:hypothetical protein